MLEHLCDDNYKYLNVKPRITTTAIYLAPISNQSFGLVFYFFSIKMAVPFSPFGHQTPSSDRDAKKNDPHDGNVSVTTRLNARACA